MLSELLSTRSIPASMPRMTPSDRTPLQVLLTSGSTGNPKASSNTQRMICANQMMLRETLAFLKDEPPVIVDMAAVNHTFGAITISGCRCSRRSSISTPASRCPAASRKPCAISGDFADGLFTCPRGMNRCCRTCARFRHWRAKFFHRLHAMFFSGGAVAFHLEQHGRTRGAGNRLSRSNADRLGATETAPVLHVGTA